MILLFNYDLYNKASRCRLNYDIFNTACVRQPIFNNYIFCEAMTFSSTAKFLILWFIYGSHLEIYLTYLLNSCCIFDREMSEQFV